MSPNKRKFTETIVSDGDDSLKHRRSSLKVNLSFSPNLTDSGNDSLRRTDMSCNNTTTNGRQSARPISKGKVSFNKSRCVSSESKQTFIDNASTSCDNIQLKDCSVILDKINNEEQTLNRKCVKLKDAILNKTREMFNEGSELSVKTTMVLGNEMKEKRVPSEPAKDNDFIYSTVTNKTPITMNAPKRITERSAKGETKEINESIGSTPVNLSKSKLTNRSKEKSRLKKKQLFTQNTNSNNIGLSSALPSPDSTSPILTGSSKRLISKRLSLKNRRKLSAHNSTICSDHSTSSVLSILGDESAITVPISCSTMIEGNLLDNESEIHIRTTNNDHQPLDVHSKRTAVSMEITEISRGFVLIDEPAGNMKSRQTSKDTMEQESPKSNHKFISSVQRSVQENVPLPIDIECSAVTEKIHKQNTIILDTQSSNECVEADVDSMTTVRMSLKVNTSINGINDASNDKSEQRSCTNKENTVNSSDKQKSVTETLPTKEQESINTTCTSLQMNTSLDSPGKTSLRRKNSKKESVPQNIDTMENLSLIERLRNISIPYNVNSESNDDNSANKEAEVEENKLNGTTKNKSRKSLNENGQSYVEATPYPTSRSMLLKSYLKQNTVAANLNVGKNTFSSISSNFKDDRSKLKDNDTNYLKTGSCYSEREQVQRDNACHEIRKITNDVIVDDSHSESLPTTRSLNTVIIEDSTDESESERNQNIAIPSSNTSVPGSRIRRKKLLPLHENSQLASFSPREGQTPPPSQQQTFRKKWKRANNKTRKMKLKIQTNSSNSGHVEKRNSEEFGSNDDISTCRDKKKEQKKKPRKIISKKIVVKRIVDQDVVSRLENDRELNSNYTQEDYSSGSRNSLNDFEPRRLPARSQKNKSHKIVIVTTGLSKGDKSLVKSVVQALGTARIESNVTRRTTHVVSTGVRTVNLLLGIIRGCWLVSLEWVLQSLENNEWLNPETYEMTHFSKAVLENRKDRQLFGASYIPELFATCGLIYVENHTKPPNDVLKDLIKSAGGYITENPKIAKIIVGTEGLKETWVLDCITTGELQSYDLYKRS